jgi:lysophospholipase L1-like esterase
MMTLALATFLALGDSYTIGESVSPAGRFPNQLATVLGLQDPVIVARTGWTTDELDRAIDAAKPKGPFDLVTLLVGVNNQYRGRGADEYQRQFDGLLKRAIAFAGGRPGHVVVISIPDWGVTPFAAGRDPKKIAEEIDRFNAINRQAAQSAGAGYVDVTPISRRAAADRSLVAEDGLHPSARMYKEWVDVILPVARHALDK